MPFFSELRALTRVQRNTFSACFLGWTLDAFDFFLLTFCLKAIAADFHAGVKQVAEAIFWTLVMRPVGAFLFGAMAERYGRRPTLMLNVVSFSVFEFASAFAPTLHSFLICRALFGVAMGGEWGVGAALALETLPARGRGFFSGLLQEGYVVGNLLAAAVFGLLFPPPARHRHDDKLARDVHVGSSARAARLLPAIQGGGVANMACQPRSAACGPEVTVRLCSRGGDMEDLHRLPAVAFSSSSS